MKKELKEQRLNRKLNSIRTTRKRVLEDSSMKNKKRKLKKLQKTLKTMYNSWILDGYTRDLLARFIDTLEEDIKSS